MWYSDLRFGARKTASKMSVIKDNVGRPYLTRHNHRWHCDGQISAAPLRTALRAAEGTSDLLPGSKQLKIHLCAATVHTRATQLGRDDLCSGSTIPLASKPLR